MVSNFAFLSKPNASPSLNPNALNPIPVPQPRLHKAPPTPTNHKYTRTIKNTLKHTTHMNNPSSNSNRQISPHQPLHRIPTRITRLLQQAVPLFLPRLPLHRLSLLQRVKRIRTCQPNTQSPITRRARHPTVASRVNADWRAAVGVRVGVAMFAPKEWQNISIISNNM